MNNLLKHSAAGLAALSLLASFATTASAQVGGTITRDLKPVPISAPLSAWEGHWAAPTMTDLMAENVLSSRFVADTRLAPETSATVATAAEFLLKIGQFPIAADRNVVDEAVEKELILPTDFKDEKVDPNATVSRELFVLWTARATGQKMMAEYAMIYMTPNFADVDQIGGRYRNAVALMQRQGIIRGEENSAFAPQRAITLAESVQILHNALERAEAEATLPVGTYRAELPAASSPGRIVEVTLAADKTVKWTTDYQNGKDPVVQVGTWRSHADQVFEVVVSLTGQGEETYDEPVNIRFNLEENRLTATSYDKSIFGAEAIELVRE